MIAGVYQWVLQQVKNVHCHGICHFLLDNWDGGIVGDLSNDVSISILQKLHSILLVDSLLKLRVDGECTSLWVFPQEVLVCSIELGLSSNYLMENGGLILHQL